MLPITDHDTYITDPNRSRSIFSKVSFSPNFMFYPQAFCIVWYSAQKARLGRYGDAEWAESSIDIMRALENVGVQIEITGLDNFRRLEAPIVFIANHMSTLETFVLPGVIQPITPVTFIVKESLLTAPVFGPVMRSRNPITVGRVNAREDLKTVLEQGAKKIAEGKSVIVFPQSTRSPVFDPGDFNSLGIKLALRAGAPVIPIALKTDAWGIGKKIKEFGKIDKNKKVYFAFGEPMEITGRGAAEHEKVISFIKEHMDKWT